MQNCTLHLSCIEKGIRESPPDLRWGANNVPCLVPLWQAQQPPGKPRGAAKQPGPCG